MLENYIAKAQGAYQRLNRELTIENTLGNRAAQWLQSKPWYNPKTIDTISNNIYSVAIGTGLDTGGAHLEPMAWLGTRGFAAVVNTMTGAWYGVYRDFVYKLAKPVIEMAPVTGTILADMFVFNTAQPLIYGSAAFISTLVFEGHADFEKAKRGAEGLILLSPFIGPSLGWFTDRIREYAGFRTAAEQAHTDE